MALIPLGIKGPYRGINFDTKAVAIKKFTLAGLSDTDGITDPQTLEDVTARALRTNVAGTIATVDPYGNIVTEALAAGELVRIMQRSTCNRHSDNHSSRHNRLFIKGKL